MPATSSLQPGKQATKHGTATRSAGKRTAAKLVRAAHELLETENFERFSLRAVADKAGVSLANLQYYFPRREDLAKALYLDVGERYAAAYAECLATAPKDPEERFKAILHWNLQDISLRATRQFFIQFWALLGSIDDFRGDYLRELYAIDIAQLTEHIGAMQPEAPWEEIRQRAVLIAAMIEGLLLVGGIDGDTSGNRSRRETIIDTALAIARGSSSAR